MDTAKQYCAYRRCKAWAHNSLFLGFLQRLEGMLLFVRIVYILLVFFLSADPHESFSCLVRPVPRPVPFINDRHASRFCATAVLFSLFCLFSAFLPFPSAVSPRFLTYLGLAGSL